MAMTIRCCCPPESWCGNRRRKAGSVGRSTAESTSRTRSATSPSCEPRPSWTRRTSATCFPTRRTGLSAAAGSWGTYATWPPRSARSSRSGIPRISWPSTRTCPPVMLQAAPRVAEQSEGDSRLSGTGLADEAEHLAGCHLEVDLRDHIGLRARQAHLEILDLKSDRSGHESLTGRPSRLRCGRRPARPRDPHRWPPGRRRRRTGSCRSRAGR